MQLSGIVRKNGKCKTKVATHEVRFSDPSGPIWFLGKQFHYQKPFLRSLPANEVVTVTRSWPVACKRKRIQMDDDDEFFTKNNKKPKTLDYFAAH